MARSTPFIAITHFLTEPSKPEKRFPALAVYLRGTVGAAALLGAAAATYPIAANAQTATTTASAPPVVVETVVVKAQRRLIRERNAPSAVTELGSADISQTGIQGSVATLLMTAPSVNVYQQGIGNNEPVLSIRGMRGLETAETLDGVPMQDLLFGGTGAYLSSILGGYYNLDQIDGVSIYPGVAYPDKNTFGTIGGTVAYDSLRPTNQEQIVVTGSAGSFGTYNEGIELDSGKFDSGLGTGDDALKVMAKYSNEQTSGFIDYTPARFNNFEAAFDKPFDDGLSLVQGTLLFNTANGLYNDEPIPLPYLTENGQYSNYPTSEQFARQQNDFLTVILKGDKYVNDYLDVGATAFFERADSVDTTYGNINLFTPPGTPNPWVVGGAALFDQTPDGFGEEGLYGPGSSGYFYDPQAYYYNGNTQFPVGSAACPASISNAWTSQGEASPCGYNAELIVSHDHTWGFQPRATITPPDIFGISNTIKLGGMTAQEILPSPKEYLWGTPDVPQTPGNLVSGYDGQYQRTIYQGYLQDKVDFLNNTLHITPGITIEGTSSDLEGSKIFAGTPSASLLASSYCTEDDYANPCYFGSYKGTKWDRDYLPFINVAYDFDRILPAAKGLSIYASAAESALFAPVSDFGPNLLQAPPDATIVHMYEAGLDYDTSKVAITADYFYQKVDRDFGFFEYQSGPLAGDEFYDNLGQREIKGFEVSGKYQVTPEIQLFGNASHQLAHYLATSLGFVTVQEDQFGIVVKGTPVTGVPDWISTFGVDYNKKSLLRADDSLDVRFEGHYTGHQYTSYDLTGFQNIGPIAGAGAYGTYDYYNVTAGATTYDPNGGINPYVLFSLDATYTMPTPGLRYVRELKFNLNVQNMFDQHYYAYYYKQISPNACGNFTSGPFKGQPISDYGCTPEFADALSGEPASVTVTISAKF